GYQPYFVEGSDPFPMHQAMAAALDAILEDLRRIRIEARAQGPEKATRPRWPMIVLRSPKGWTGPKVVNGKPVEGTHRAHQVPLSDVRDNAGHLKMLETWMKSYKPKELFDASGRIRSEIAALAPKGERRMGANPHA